jgi:hypothetical protein
MLPYGVLQCFLEKPKEMEIAWVRRQSDPAMNKKAQLEKLRKSTLCSACRLKMTLYFEV